MDAVLAGTDAAINVAGTEIGVKTDASVATAAIQGTIDGYGAITGPALFVFHDSTEGNAVLYYDAAPSVAGGASKVASLTNITTLGGLSGFDGTDFLFS